jgi:hypothetical protein
MIRSEKTPVLLHVPKTGGTTLRFSLDLPTWFKVHRAIGGPRMKALIQRSDNPHLFVFGRDPIDRAISAYYYFVVSRNDAVKPPPGFSAIKQRAWLFSCIARIADMDVNGFYRGMFRDNALQYRRLSKVLVHFMPLKDWVDKASGLGLPIHYYDFSTFADEYQRLLSDIVAKDRPRLQHRMNNVAQREKWGVPLAPDVEEMLRDFYAEDYELLRRGGIQTR